MSLEISEQPGNCGLEKAIWPYGDCLFSYCGQGTLVGAEQYEAECEFAAVQVNAGHIFLLCDFKNPAEYGRFHERPPTLFRGRTSANAAVESAGEIYETNWLSETHPEPPYARVAYLLQRLSVGGDRSQSVRRAKFGFTNFDLARKLVFPLSIGESDATVSISPVKNAKSKLHRLKTLHTTDVTCELIVSPSGSVSPDALEQAVNDVSYVLSIARGTKVQWIYRRDCDEDDAEIRMTHCNRFTKGHTGLAIIDPRPRAEEATLNFIGSALPRYQRLRDAMKLDRGPVDAYLDAKSAGDFLETRSAKIAIAMEVLKNTFLSMSDSPFDAQIIPESDLSEALLVEVESEVRRVLERYGINRKMRNDFATQGKLRGLNRHSFQRLVARSAKHLGVPISENEIRLFVNSRDCLIHAGRFYCQACTQAQRSACPPLESPVEEWLFLLNVLDRFFLRLLGYEGPYIDWSRPDEPRTEQLSDTRAT